MPPPRYGQHDRQVRPPPPVHQDGQQAGGMAAVRGIDPFGILRYEPAHEVQAAQHQLAVHPAKPAQAGHPAQQEDPLLPRRAIARLIGWRDDLVGKDRAAAQPPVLEPNQGAAPELQLPKGLPSQRRRRESNDRMVARIANPRHEMEAGALGRPRPPRIRRNEHAADDHAAQNAQQKAHEAQMEALQSRLRQAEHDVQRNRTEQDRRRAELFSRSEQYHNRQAEMDRVQRALEPPNGIGLGPSRDRPQNIPGGPQA